MPQSSWHCDDIIVLMFLLSSWDMKMLVMYAIFLILLTVRYQMTRRRVHNSLCPHTPDSDLLLFAARWRKPRQQCSSCARLWSRNCCMEAGEPGGRQRIMVAEADAARRNDGIMLSSVLSVPAIYE